MKTKNARRFSALLERDDAEWLLAERERTGAAFTVIFRRLIDAARDGDERRGQQKRARGKPGRIKRGKG